MKSDSEEKKVVFNENTGNFAILSGVIIVKMKDNSVFSDPSFDIVKSYPKIGYYLVKIPAKTKIKDTLSKIKTIENVEDVTVEVLENFKESL